MSWFTNIGKAIGKALTDTGHAVGSALNNKVVDSALALAGQAVGIPAPATMAALQAAGGALKPGGGLKDAAIGGAEGAAEGFAGEGVGKALGALGSTGLGQAISKVPVVGGLVSNAAAGGAPSSDIAGAGAGGAWAQDAAGNFIPAAANAGSSASGSGIGNVFRSLGSAISKSFTNPDGSINWGQIAKTGLGAAQIGSNIAAQNNENKYLNSQLALRNNVLNQAETDYNNRAPLRASAFGALGSMLANGSPTTGVYAPFLPKPVASTTQQPTTSNGTTS